MQTIVSSEGRIRLRIRDAFVMFIVLRKQNIILGGESQEGLLRDSKKESL